MKIPVMKTSITPLYSKRFTRFIIIGWMALALALISFSVFAQIPKQQSDAGEKTIRLNATTIPLNFPKTVERYYQTKSFKLSWVDKVQKNANTEVAMMLLDCIKQFGLNPADYHPNELLYSKLKALHESPDSLADSERTVFDILLTDAVITMMNHLHYGKFNPTYSKERVDNGNLGQLNADFLLFRTIDSPDFYSSLIEVQPTSPEYLALQKNMQLVLGQYILDSYEYPQANVRKMAINMERLRWEASRNENHIQLNIPSFQLKLNVGSSISLFKVIVGNEGNPTQTLESTLSRFTAAPELKVPAELFVAEILPKALRDIRYLQDNHYSIFDNQLKRLKINHRRLIRVSQNPAAYSARQAPSEDNTLGNILFRIDDHPDATLYDHRDGNVFNNKERAFSKGRLQLENPKLFAKTLLIADGSSDQVAILESALKEYQYKNFYLKKPFTIAVTYLTCEMIDSILVIYKDIYQRDPELENKIFGKPSVRLAKAKLNRNRR